MCRFLTAFALGCMVWVSAAADITGKWTASFETQIGEQRDTFDLTVTGSRLTGTASSENGKSDIKNSKADGDTVTFVGTMTFQGMTIDIS